MGKNRIRFILSLAAAIAIVFAALVNVISAEHSTSGVSQSSSSSIQLAVNFTTGKKTISPYIYGLQNAKASFAKEIGLPVRRWGGNDVSRYDWQTNSFNHAQDWFYENDTHTEEFTNAAETADQWVAQNVSTGADSIISVPMMGYVSKDGLRTSCGFSISKYGTQNSKDYDPYSDCGNGYAGPAGSAGIPTPSPTPTPITGNNPLDTSRLIDKVVGGVNTPDATHTTGWVNHLTSKFGTAAKGGVKFYALDNEPGIWHETHRDVHPTPLTYDESYARGSVYAAAIKAADPSALVLGPVPFGWPNYFYASYVTQTQADQDKNNHGGMDFIPWYLKQMYTYEKSNGTRILDYLDVHFYPQNGVDLVLDDNQSKTQALRLRSTRALWDSTYVDESYIGTNGINNGIVRLIPMMHEWVDANYPNTKLSISEYNWGALESINGALTQADILGIFGQQGLDMACLFVYGLAGDPSDSLKYTKFDTLPGGYAFRMYRNYDGAGGKFGDTSVTATSSDRATLAVYAATRASDSASTIMVINKTGSSQAADVTLTGISSTAASAKVYRYSGDNLTAIVRQTDQTLGSTGFSASFPANSISLFVIAASSDNNTTDSSAAASAINAIYEQYASWFGTASGSLTSGTYNGITYYTQWFSNGAAIVAGYDGNLYTYYNGTWYGLSIVWKDYGKAASAINTVYAKYASWFGTKAGGLTSATYNGITYYVQWFSNGAAIVAGYDGNLYTYYNGTWYSLGVTWK
ncbi:MAG: hypothetical protein L7F77_11080 [Candidatus Magnetominusculus sp. LBB02]|nr:hypothetical protein [Candidatus Magnetominusculus sp. LBB02]